MSDEAVEKKQIIKIRTNQSVSLTPSMTRPGPADTRNRFPLSTRVLGLASAGILLSVVFCWETWPGLRLGTARPRESWHLSQWPESRVSGVLRLRHPDKRIIARSQSIEAVTSNWSIIDPGQKGRSREKCWDPAQFKDVTKLCSGVLSTKYPRRAIVDWLNLDIWQRFMEARPYNWLNFMELGFQVMGVNLILASSRR